MLLEDSSVALTKDAIDPHMVGLRRGTARVEPSDARWAAVYDVLKHQLEALLAGQAVMVEHVGNTAVPGLPAKPIVDVAIGAPPEQWADVIKRLVNGGFEDRGARPEQDEHLLVVPDPTDSDVRVAHLHLVALDSAKWRDYVRFRDLLRSDAQCRTWYATLKQQLADEHPNDRAAYTSGKSAFIRDALASR